ncbi:ABC transporter ATP-binding protein [Algoriphagus sanaruensis]|uniref:ABC transporter ATP-binding protein n=1 Tax=Algoriphagus sanaruensis TaxID=1727163 RepID=A0A142EMM1_9BACT|nr:ABC transporter ATP-binding protein [Algoriphagus sanaruensis]AMQ56376.1 ABC transporter ATP-binding protein [Algoriphagus sanaruensis]
MKIQLTEASKRFQYEWIFKNLNLHLQSGDSLAVTGSNGSGKSTLLKCIAGSIPLSSGKITWANEQNEIPSSDWYQKLSISAPYLELPEEFTLSELLDFHFQFKTPIPEISISEMVKTMYLDQHANKPVSQFSSGMKQRVKLSLALFSDCPVVFLDEPTSNLDARGIAWYLELIKNFGLNRILIICSNEPREFEFCTKKIKLEEYK